MALWGLPLQPLGWQDQRLALCRSLHPLPRKLPPTRFTAVSGATTMAHIRSCPRMASAELPSGCSSRMHLNWGGGDEIQMRLREIDIVMEFMSEDTVVC